MSAQVKEDAPISASLKHRLRDIFSPKAAVRSALASSSSTTTSSTSSSTTRKTASASSAHPTSRIPIRKKRSFRDVAQDDDGDESDASTNPRARIRQRVDSNASIATLRGGKSISRKGSTDSVKTIRDGGGSGSGGGSLKRTQSSRSLSVSLNPGQAAPARAVLTRTTSHNQVQNAEPEKRTIVPFPTKRHGSLKAPARAGASDYKATRASKDVSVSSSSVSRHTLQRTKSSRSLATIFSEDVTITAHRPAPPPPVRRSLSPPPSVRPTTAAASKPRIELSPEDEILRQVLEYVVNEPDDDDADATEVRALLSNDPPKLSDFATPASPPVLSLPDSALPEIPDDDEEEEVAVAPRSSTELPRLGERVFYPPRRPSASSMDRFDVKVEPMNKHVALWDLNPTDVFFWPANLVLTDHAPTDAACYSPPHIKNVDVSFQSTDDASTSTSPSTAHDFHSAYQGHTIEHDSPAEVLALDPSEGIAIEGHWRRTYVSASDYYAEYPESATYGTRMYVPIPASVFKGRECRFFKLKARVIFASGAVAHSGTVRVSVEHLRKEVHMDGRRASLDV